MMNFLQVVLTIFGVMDPVGNVPVFLSVTARMDEARRQRMATGALIRASVILLLFIFLGDGLLEAFKISIFSFRLAGGLIMILLGLQILFNISLAKKEGEDDDVSMVPLATPLIAGPGMIAVAVILAREYGYVLTIAGFAVNLVLSRILFRYAHWVIKVLGKKGTAEFTKVIGLLLLAIGIEFIRKSFGAA